MVYTIIPNVCNLYQKNDPAFLLKCALMNVDLFANTHYLDWDQKPLHCCMLKFWCVGKYSGGFFGAPFKPKPNIDGLNLVWFSRD